MTQHESAGGGVVVDNGAEQRFVLEFQHTRCFLYDLWNVKKKWNLATPEKGAERVPL